MRWLLYRFLPYYLLLSLLLSLGLLLGTELGLRLVWAQVESRLPAGLSVRAVHGRLLDQVRLKGVRYVDGEREIRVETAWLDWQPLALLRGRIVIREIVVADGHMHWPTAPAPEPAEDRPLPARLPALPDWRLGRLQLRQLTFSNGQAAPLVLESARLEAAMRDQVLSLRVTPLVLRDWGRWQLQLEGQMAATEIVLQSLALRGGPEPALQLEGQGRCGWPTLDCAAELGWTSLRWPLHEGRWFSPDGRLTLQYAPDGPLAANIEAELHGEQLPASQLQAQLRSQAEGYVIEGGWRAGATGQLDLAATYTPARTMLEGRLRATDLDLGYWQPDLESRLTGHADLSVSGPQAVELSALQVKGELRGQALSLGARGRYDTQGWAIRDLDLAVAGSRLRGEIARNPNWRGRVELKAPDLAVLHPQLAGALNLQARLQGQGRLPQLDWELSGRRLGFAQDRLAQLDFKGQLNERAVNWRLLASGGERAGLELQELELQTRGTPERASSRLRLRSSAGALELAARSAWQAGRGELQLVLESGRLDLGGEAWQLEAQPAARLARTGAWLDRQCWASGAMRSCLAATFTDDKLQAQWQLTGYRLERLNPRLPGLAQLSGEARADLTIPASPIDNLQAQLALNTSAIELARRLNGDAETLLQLRPGTLNATLDAGRIAARWQFPLQDDPGLSGELTLGAERQLDGRVRLQVGELDWLGALVPEVLEARGKIDAALQFQGSLEQPAIQGQFLLSEGEIHLETPQTVLRQVSVRLQGDGSSAMQMRMQARSGEGQLAVDGRLGWQQGEPSLDAALSGQDFLAVDTDQVRVVASPQLQIQLAGRDVSVNGSVRIPAARLQPRSLATDGRRAPSGDQLILGEETTASPYRLRSDVEIRLGDAVNFSGFGLSAGVAGRLKTRVRPGQAATGLGELSLVNGHYKAYGQDLRIERGRLIFSGGPLTEPGLDVRAYRQATSDIRAGVTVRGTIQRPELSLYSDPAMRETDQLSYLVLGRAAESQSKEDQAALNNAALALGLKGSNFLAGRLKGKLGLDEVRIGTQAGEQSSQASLVLGKYLSPELYVSYGLGLFEPVYTFKLRYELSRHWTLQTESGVESGGDLFYTIER